MEPRIRVLADNLELVAIVNLHRLNQSDFGFLAILDLEWLHVGQEVGGERAANPFTRMGSCRRLGVEPYEYLCGIVPRLGRHPQKDIWELTP